MQIATKSHTPTHCLFRYTMADQMARLAFAPIGDEELQRAKNMLKCNVLTCLESHHMVFEDIGQQLIYDDTYLNPVCRRKRKRALVACGG